jgi:hypothetical protein
MFFTTKKKMLSELKEKNTVEEFGLRKRRSRIPKETLEFLDSESSSDEEEPKTPILQRTIPINRPIPFKPKAELKKIPVIPMQLLELKKELPSKAYENFKRKHEEISQEVVGEAPVVAIETTSVVDHDKLIRDLVEIICFKRKNMFMDQIRELFKTDTHLTFEEMIRRGQHLFEEKPRVEIIDILLQWHGDEFLDSIIVDNKINYFKNF